MKPTRTLVTSAVLAAAFFAGGLAGCASTTMKVKESLGIPKREQLVSEVKDARNAQQQAKEQFASTLDEFKAITGYDGGDLERRYRRLQDQADRSKSRAEAVSGRIKSIETISSAMFREWEQELREYSSETLREASAEQLAVTRRRYRELMEKMKTAEASMGPVLTAFNDQTLFLKHNLNARAIASLQSTVTELETEIGRLIEEMNASIDEANAFIRNMEGVGGDAPAAG
jgi:hypothetical protein